MSATLAPVIGSGWDAIAPGPDAPLAHHLAEWVEGSAVAPELAAANVVSLQGQAVLEALAGDRLEALAGHASQYATGAVAHLLRPLEPLAAAGGWWCSGLDPLTDWRIPMAWGCFKPDAPRWDHERNRARKYEHPLGAAARLFWLRVPATIAARVADRFGLALPIEVGADTTGEAGAFWRWWAAEPRLPLVLDEGGKKTGALLTIGLPAVGTPGIWNPAPKGADGRPALLPELAGVPLKDRQVWVLYDYSESRKGRQEVAKAYRRVGRLLAAEGADVLVGACPGPHKGADDALAAGVPWATLAAQLQPLKPSPVLPWLRAADRVAPAHQWLGVACPIPSPSEARLVALQAPMGSGKTEAIAAAIAPLLQAGQRVVLITHRRTLGAALAERLGLPWADEAAPGCDLRQMGIALCVDSLCSGSLLRFRAADWAGAVVVIDEAAQVMTHALMARGTAIAERRPQVLMELSQLLAAAAQVIAADALLSTPVLEALETAAGARAFLIASDHHPAAGRRLVVHTRDSWRVALEEHLQRHQRIWIATTAQRADADNSAQNIAELVQTIWPEARIKVNDSDHPEDAELLARDPNGVASQIDVLITTPVTGLSVTLQGHFDAVFGWSGGTTDPAAVVQALGRVRDGCPRHLYVPENSPGAALRIGSGATNPTTLLRQLKQHEAVIVTQLLAAGGWSPTTTTTGPWLPCWAQMAAAQNGQRLAFSATVLALLEREGYCLETAAALEPQQEAAAGRIAEQLKAIATEAQAAEDRAVIAAEPISDREAAALEKRRRLAPADRAKRERHRIAKTWGLGGAAPTPELLQADREGLARKLRFGWMLRSRDARELVARADLATAQRLAPSGASWAPDLCEEMEGPRLQAADSLGLTSWLERADCGDWFGADDPALQRLQITATTHAGSMAQVLGLSPGKRATTTLRQLLAAAGYRLETKRCRAGKGRHAAAGYRYRVVQETPPPGANPEAMEQGWRADLQARAAGGVYQKPPINKWGEQDTPLSASALQEAA